MLVRGLLGFVRRDQIETLMAILTNVIDVPDAREIAAYSSDAGPLTGTGVTLLTYTY